MAKLYPKGREGASPPYKERLSVCAALEWSATLLLGLALL